MKPIKNQSIAIQLGLIVLCCNAAKAAGPYYWDNNGATTGFGTASGTWSDTTSLFSLDSTGGTAPSGSVDTTDGETVNFGTANVGGGLAGGTIDVDGTGIDYGLTTFRLAQNISFGSQNTGDITFNSINGGRVVIGNGSITNNSLNSDLIFNTDVKGYTLGFRGATGANIILNGDYFDNNTTLFNVNVQINGTYSNSATKSLTFRNNATLQISSNSDITLAGNVRDTSSTGSVIIKDTSTTSTLLFSKDNTGTTADQEYSGKYSVQAGTMQFGKRNALYAVQDSAAWTAANIRVGNTGIFAINVGAADEFTTADVTTLLTNLGGANGTSTTGFASGSAIGFDTTNAVGGTFTISDNIADSTGSGGGALGVRKLGTNTLVLSGVNTYTGDTVVKAGTLNLASSAELLFEVGALGDNNAITGTGTVDLDGLFRFDLTNASINGGDFWNIVDVGNLTETYGSNFSVASLNGDFTETGVDTGIWTLDENGITYEFSELSGTLTVIPEPSALLLGGLGLLALLRRRR